MVQRARADLKNFGPDWSKNVTPATQGGRMRGEIDSFEGGADVTPRPAERTSTDLHPTQLRALEVRADDVPDIPTEAELALATMALRDAVLPNLTVSPDFADALRESPLFAMLQVPLNPTIEWHTRGANLIDKHLQGRLPFTVMYSTHIETTFLVGDTTPQARVKVREFGRAVAAVYCGSLGEEPVVEMRRQRQNDSADRRLHPAN